MYYDARADDARLTLAVARTAALDYGAAVTNYTDVVSLVQGADGKVKGAQVRSAVPVPGAAGATVDFEVQAKVVINATGVWADDVRALDEGAHPRSIRPAKGIHVTVPRSRLPADIAAVIPVPKDRRSIFAVPWPDGDDVYLGTTDTDWDGPLDDPACTPDDVAYLIDAANGVTSSNLTPDDVTGVWAGLRPLLDRSKAKHVSARTADLSRRHTVRRVRPRRSDGHGRQAHHLPAHGAGHRRRRRGASAGGRTGRRHTLSHGPPRHQGKHWPRPLASGHRVATCRAWRRRVRRAGGSPRRRDGRGPRPRVGSARVCSSHSWPGCPS